jgi:PII-like signaling protein
MQARRIRIYIGERDKSSRGKPLSEAIVNEARRRGLAGATVFKGVAGFGANSLVHTAKILRLSEDLPLVVEIVDERDKLADFLTWLDGEVREGLVTAEEVEVVVYRSSRQSG